MYRNEGNFDGRRESFDMGTLLSQMLRICPISLVFGPTDPQIQRAKGPRPITKAKAKVAWFQAMQRTLKRLVVFIIIVNNGKYAKYFVHDCLKKYKNQFLPIFRHILAFSDKFSRLELGSLSQATKKSTQKYIFDLVLDMSEIREKWSLEKPLWWP